MSGFLAEVVMYFHLAYVCFVVFGQLAIFVGMLQHNRWVRNLWFRWIHLLMMSIVTVEAILDIECPLITLEYYLRRQAGEPNLEGAFLARCLEAMSVAVPDWAYPPIYLGVGVLAAGTFILAPPRRKKPRLLTTPVIF